MITITVDIGPAQKLFADILTRGLDATPVWADFGAHMLTSVRQNFEAGGRPVPWAPLKVATTQGWVRSYKGKTYHKGWKSEGWGLTAAGEKAVSGRKPLIASGLLFNSFHWRLIPNGVVIGTSEGLKAAIHQFGAHTDAHEIRPRTKKALFWFGAAHPYKSVQHPGSTIPARPFLLVQDEDWRYLKERCGQYLATGRLT